MRLSIHRRRGRACAVRTSARQIGGFRRASRGPALDGRGRGQGDGGGQSAGATVRSTRQALEQPDAVRTEIVRAAEHVPLARLPAELSARR